MPRNQLHLGAGAGASHDGGCVVDLLALPLDLKHGLITKVGM
jgi:hypothetical protein